MSATRARKPRLTLTERTLLSMLTENTGRHMLDSGGAYGRAWERNQGVDFKASPAATLKIRPCDWRNQHAEIEVTLDLFHWLSERVDYDPRMTGQFTRFANRPENKDSHWLELAETFANDVRKGTGIYYDGKPITVNTYNGEDLLSQTIQYVYWTEEETREEYILLQIHGGCDVRGGYTAPKVFRASIEEYSIMDNAKAVISEIMPKHLEDQATLPGIRPCVENPYWTTDDGCNWYFEGGCGLGAGKPLEEYEVSEDPADKGQGKIFIDADGVAYGPYHGGKLEVYAGP